MIDFDADDWQEQMLLEQLNKPNLIHPKVSAIQSAYKVLGILNIYLESKAVGQNDTAIFKASDRLNLITTYLQQRLLDKEPLKTTEINKETVNKELLKTIEINKDIANFIDGLVLYGAKKADAIKATADWLGRGVYTVENAAKSHCRVKFKTKGQIDNFERSKKSYILIGIHYTLRLIKSREKQFFTDNKSVQSAYELMIADYRPVKNFKQLPPLV